jgi:hypothetical protein
VAEVANEGTFEEHLVVVKRKMPKRKRKFGKGARRGGDRKTSQSGTGDQLVFAAEGDATADIQATVSATSVAVKQMNRKQLHRSLDWTTKKLKCAEMKEAKTVKKLTAAKAQCIVLAKLAQERRKEGHLAVCEIKTAQRIADDAVSNAQDKIIAERGFHLAKAKATAITTCKQHTKELLLQQEEAKATAITTRKQHTKELLLQQEEAKATAITTRKQHTKELLLQQEECNIVVNDMKSEFQSKLKSNEKKYHAKSTRIIQREVKDAKSTVLAYTTTISDLKIKVASFDATLHQLKKSHENDMMELALAHRSKVHTIHARHASTIFEEKQKLRIRMVSNRQIQNTLYNEVLDARRHARDMSKSVWSSKSLLSQRLIRMKEWRSKCAQLSDSQDELVDHLRDMEVMEQQLKEYNDIISSQQNTIEEMTPTPQIFAKQWVKNRDKRGGHMEWTVECDKLIMELLANRCPPVSIQASILAMARYFFRGQDVVRELPCLRSIRYMRTVLLRTTKSLAAYRLGSADAWKQLHTDETSRRQISIVNVVVGLIGSDGILRSICLSGSIIAEDSTAENQSRAIISSFTESSQLLADWIKTTAEMFPDRDDLLDLIPKPSSMCVSKLLNGMVSTDTCNTAQLTRSTIIEHIYRICRERGMPEIDLKIFAGK